MSLLFCLCVFFFVIPFFAQFLCFFYISDSLSCVLNSVLYINVIVHVYGVISIKTPYN